MLTQKKSNSLFYLLFIVVILVFAFTASAQITGGMNETTSTRLGGTNYVAGTVYSPTGIPMNSRISVRLSSPGGGEYITSTDDRGQFIFSGLTAGSYTVTVEAGKDFETANEQVEILQSRTTSRQTYTVSIRLIERRNADGKPAVVNQASIRIPKEANKLYKKAIDLSKDGDYNGAIEQLKLAIAEYSEFTLAYNEIGVQYLKLNELEKAVEALQSALKIDPKAFEPLVNYGIALFRLKKYKESEPVLREALKVKNAPVCHYYLGRILTSLEQFDEAEKEFNSAISLGGDQMREAHRMLANLYIAKGDNKRAIKSLEKYLDLTPDAPDAENLRKVISQLKNQKSQPKQ